MPTELLVSSSTHYQEAPRFMETKGGGSHQSWQAGVDQREKKKRAVHNGEEGKELAEHCQHLEGIIKECNKTILKHYIKNPL